ncbi:MAG: TatD family hydrolase [Coriobacteriia bacterium]|nr:TatD family hydrolase [Coriobacteriia bacterium]
MNNFEFIAYKGKKKLPVQVPIPDLQGAPLVETHAHLDMLEDPALALARAAHVGITTVLTLTDLSAQAELTYEMLDVWCEGAQMLLDARCADSGAEASRLEVDGAHEASGQGIANPVLPDTYIMVGVHPHNSRHYDSRIEKQLYKLAADPRTVAIGEAGLDYYYDHSPRDVQQKVFARKLEVARDLGLPVIIHLRDAHEHGLRILREVGVPEAGAVLHCYNREFSVAEPFLEIGCTLGFGGPVTFKNAHEVKEAATAVPAGSFVVETDCPFMAPQPFRGQKCEPAHTLWVAEEIARLRAVSLPDLARETSDTAKRIFNLP